MIIKVCGMRDPDNVAQVVGLGVDTVGFICYAPSPRYVGRVAPPTPLGVARVGVFVDEEEAVIRDVSERNTFTHIQLHGSEPPELCRRLAERWRVIKAILIGGAEDFAQAAAYDGVCDLLLFDTRCARHGGSGQRFDWSLLRHYTGQTPFLLSGGISPDDGARIAAIDHPRMAGVDLNSRFEDQPGIKNRELLKHFIDEQNR